MRHLSALLSPSRDLPGLARLRHEFELVLPTALWVLAPSADEVIVDPSATVAVYAPLEDLLHDVHMFERESCHVGDDLHRDLWFVLAPTFDALRADLMPAGMTVERLAARVNPSLRQYSHNNVHLLQGLLTDALYLLVGMAYSNAPATPVGDDTLGPNIVVCAEISAIPPTHASAGVLHTR